MPIIHMNTQKYVTLAHNIIYKKKSKRGCKSRFSLEHKINKIFYVCSYLRTWGALNPECIHKPRTRNKVYIYKYIKDRTGKVIRVIKTLKPVTKNMVKHKKKQNKNKDTLEPDTYRKMFNKWSKDGIFELAYKLFLKDIVKKYKLENTTFYIDSTNIQNMNGNSEEANMASKIKSKRSAKITAVVNINKIPFSLVTGKGSSHDSKFTIEAMEKFMVPVIFTPENQTYLVGDPAYGSKEKAEILAKQGTKLLVRPKKNAINKQIFTEKEEVLLKKRACVEHFFSDIRRNYIQVEMKFASKIHNYMSFVYLACLNAVNNHFVQDMKL